MSSEARTDEDDRIEELEARVEELEAQDSLTSGTVPISRRGLLKGSAALGIGALGGSVLSDGNSGRVTAQTAAGQVGTDTDRVDVYSNLVDANAVSTDSLLNSTFTDRVRGIASGGIVSSIDPTSTTTPVQDAIDTVYNEGGGTVQLPPKTVNESATINRKAGVALVGHGIATSGGSTIKIDAGSTSPGMVWDSCPWTWTHNVRIEGPGSGVSTGPAIQFTGNDSWNVGFGRVKIENWGNKAVDCSSAGPFESHWKTLMVRDVDAGDQPAVVDMSDLGPQNSISNLAVYPDDARTASDSTVLRRQFGDLHVGTLNVGAQAGVMADIYDSNWQTKIDGWNWEPGAQNTTTYEHIIKVRGRHRARIGAGRRGAGSADFAYGIIDGNNTELGHWFGWASGSYNTNVLELVSGAANNIVFEGPGGDVTNTAGSGNDTVACLADLQMVG